MALLLARCLLLWLASTSTTPQQQQEQQSSSQWSQRTARKRRRTEELLSSIRPPPFLLDAQRLQDVVIDLLDAPCIDWRLYPQLDPQQGGNLQPDTPRSRRKQRQIEAFVHVARQLLQLDDGDTSSSSLTIVDAGCGAGNLAIPLAALTECPVMALDVNVVALQRLQERASCSCSSPILNVTTQCVDLATAASIDEMDTAAMVCSLHACGAATDLAIRLATRHGIPFCVSPCCTAKAVTARRDVVYQRAASSQQRSSAPVDMSYPRSQWLHDTLLSHGMVDNVEQGYVTLAKVADVGLGPQTPTDQVKHQRLAKLVVELDRLARVVERHDYRVRLVAIQGHEAYGKRELLVGVPPHYAVSLDTLRTV